jgi:hypothetical protein
LTSLFQKWNPPVHPVTSVEATGKYFNVTVIWLYLTLVHVTLVFSLSLIHHDSSSRLQYLAQINISHISHLYQSASQFQT